MPGSTVSIGEAAINERKMITCRQRRSLQEVIRDTRREIGWQSTATPSDWQLVETPRREEATFK